ncbi:hypothetical protein, partial [Siminovitchia fortis]|uniref:hypothetical protein n=1 Tax=Siminovitchia fortis TaxID=254758 RepID=UPI0011AA903A
MKVLREEKEEVRNILRSMGDGVMRLRRDGRILMRKGGGERFLEEWGIEGSEGNGGIGAAM